MQCKIVILKVLIVFKYPTKLVKAIDNDELPDLIGFSNFTWNSALSLSFAKKIKELKKEIIVVFGGLEYHDDDDRKIEFLNLIKAL